MARRSQSLPAGADVDGEQKTVQKRSASASTVQKAKRSRPSIKQTNKGEEKSGSSAQKTGQKVGPSSKLASRRKKQIKTYLARQRLTSKILLGMGLNPRRRKASCASSRNEVVESEPGPISPCKKLSIVLNINLDKDTSPTSS